MEHKSLAFGAAGAAQLGELGHGFDPVGDEGQMLGSGVREDLGDAFLGFAHGELEGVRIGACGADGKEIAVEAVHDHAQALGAQRRLGLQDEPAVLKIRRLADFNLQIARRNLVFFQHAGKESGHVEGEDIRAGNIHADGQRTDAAVEPFADGLEDLFPDVLVKPRDEAVLFDHVHEGGRSQQAQLRIVPADERFAADDLAVEQVAARLQIEAEFTVVDGLLHLLHDSLTALALAGGSLGNAPGQPVELVQNRFDASALEKKILLLHGGHDVHMEIQQEQIHFPHGDIPRQLINQVVKDGEDDAGDGGIEGELNAAQKRFNAAERGVDGAEADVGNAHDQTEERTQQTDTGQRAGDLQACALPAVQRERILVDDGVHIADDFAPAVLAVGLVHVFLEKPAKLRIAEQLRGLLQNEPGIIGTGAGNAADALACVLNKVIFKKKIAMDF